MEVVASHLPLPRHARAGCHVTRFIPRACALSRCDVINGCCPSTVITGRLHRLLPPPRHIPEHPPVSTSVLVARVELDRGLRGGGAVGGVEEGHSLFDRQFPPRHPPVLSLFRQE